MTARRLASIASDVGNCRLCPRLVQWREQVATEKRAAYRDETYWGRGVPAFGDPKATVIVVGLAPAAHGANRSGRMFTGDRSGDWLFRAMHKAGFANQAESTNLGDGLQLKDALVTSPVKCAPPANKPTPAERDACRPFLDRELEVVTGKVFVALGAFAYQALCSYFEVRPRPKFGHGVEVEVELKVNGTASGPTSTASGPTSTASGPTSTAGPTILCSFHVSQQNTFTGRLTEEMLDSVFARARELAGLPGVR